MRGKITAGDAYDPNYCVDLGSRGVLDPQTPFRYLNHSCDPNCELLESWVKGEPHLWVFALRRIRALEELTIDYGWPLESAIPCLCGSALCRGWIIDAEELARLREKAARSA
jgi:SET domain-containing protein